MGDRSAIEWCDATWNPVTGCSKVSPGCAHCYAATLAPRLARMGQHGYSELPWTPENAAANVVLHEDRLELPFRWRRPRRIFVNSMSDLFHELVPDAFIGQVFAVMAQTQQHTFQVLTKRPDRMRAFIAGVRHCEHGWLTHNGDNPRTYRSTDGEGKGTGEVIPDAAGWPLPNVWLGTSVENQTWADRRIPELLATPAAVRFLSCEPLLGPVDITAIARRGAAGFMRPLDGRFNRIDWVIAGGESGPDARPVHTDWVRSIRDQCAATGVPFLFKQWGGRTPKSGGRELDGRTWDEYPGMVP